MQEQLEETASLTEEIKAQHQQLLSWAELFDAASMAEKKIIAGHILKAVIVSRDYHIQIEFNISEADYLNGMQL